MDDEIIFKVLREEDIRSLTTTFCFPWESPEVTREKWYNYYIEQKKGLRTVYLVERKSQLIGYGSLLRQSKYPHFSNAGIPEIHDLWITPEMRHRGYGKALLLRLEELARSEGFNQVGLGVGLYADYGPAQKLYAQMGYIPDSKGITYEYAGVIPGKNYMVDDELILWLKKTLPNPESNN